MRLKIIPLLIVLMGAVMARAEGEPEPVAETPGAKAALAEINQLIEKNIPEEYRTPPAPLPDDQNAWTWWKQAVAMMDAVPIEKSRVFWHLDDNPATLTDEQITQAEQWLKELQPVFDLIERGNQAGDFRATMKPDCSDMPPLGRLRMLMNLYLFRAERAIKWSDFAQAEKYLSHAMDMGGVMSRGDNPLVVYLAGIAIQGGTINKINAWLPQQTNRAFLTALLKIVPEEQHPGVRSQRAVIGELSFTIPFLRYFAVQTASDQPMDVRVKAAANCFVFELMELSDEQKRTVLQFLLEHSRVFDSEPIFKSQIPNALAAIKQAQAPWDPAFLPEMPEDAGFLHGGMKTLVDRVKANQPLDPAQLQDAIRFIENDPGISYNKRTLLLDRANIALQHMTRLNIAIRLFQLQTGQSPQSLGELVTHKILDKLPPDPFCDKPIRYDAKRLLLWSVGENGIDDGGEGHPDETDATKFYSGPDYVWRIAPPSR